jgi:hypothetical protein
MLTLYTKSARKLSAAPARNAKLRLVGLAPRATLVPRLSRVGLALRANLAASFASSARGEGQGFALTSPQGGRGKATPLPFVRMPLPPSFAPLHLSLLRTPYSVLSPFHLCTGHRPICTFALPLLRPPYSTQHSVLFSASASYLSTFPPLHLCTAFVTHGLSPPSSVL